MNAQETQSVYEKSGQAANAPTGGDRSCCTTSCCGGSQAGSNLDGISAGEETAIMAEEAG
jgi:hypothetical protein